MKVTEILGENI